MSTEDTSPKINPGDIILWPMLKLDYDTSPDKISALLPPGIEVGEDPYPLRWRGLEQRMLDGQPNRTVK